MKTKKLLLSLLLPALFACSPREDMEDANDAPGAAVEGPALEDAELPESVTREDLSEWNVQLDDPTGDAAGFQLMVQDAGLRVTTGPAGIAWRPVDLVMSGDFTVSATFQDRGAPSGDAEGYGLVVGGRNLNAPDRHYTYFLVRSTGEHRVMRRDGEETEVLVDWTSAAPAAADDSAAATTTGATRLAVEVRGDEVRFLRNGAVIETLSTDRARPYGVSGARVSQQHDVGISDWSVTGERVGEGAAGPEAEEAEPAAGPGGGGR
jgi:hypothetical protein